MDRIYWSTGQFILGMYRGTESVAVYSVAIQLKDMFYMFSTAISGVFLPKVTALVCKGVSDKEVSDLFIRTGRIQYILMSFVLTGFILLGRSFVNLWAGPDYNQSYIIALLFFIPTLVPLIQNLGITILMARNQLRFRSLLILIISVASLFLAVPLAYRFGAIGCAIATSIAIIIGHGIILNIYYDKEIRLDISLFWKEIIKMSFVPLIIIIIGGIVLRFIAVNTFTSFVVAGLALIVIFVPSFYFISMNKSERELFTKPIIQLVKRIR